MIVKFVLSVTFVFETPGSYNQAIVHMCCAGVQLYTVYHRYREALLFVQSVHWALLSYETILVCLFISVPAHKLASMNLTVSTLILLLIGSLLITFLLVYR